VTLEIIKAAYKTLVKKFHPDVNSNCPMAEERSKNINAAYTMLRLSYEKYEKLEEKFKG
jgi:DnaJ-class molecular chaperone